MRCWRLGCWTTGPAPWTRSCCPAWRVPAGLYVVISVMCDVKSTCMSSSLLRVTWRVPVRRHLSYVWRDLKSNCTSLSLLSVTWRVPVRRHLSYVWSDEYLHVSTSWSLLCVTWKVPAGPYIDIALKCDVKSTFVYHLCCVWHEEYARHLRYVWYKKYLCMSSLLYVTRRVSKSSIVCVA